MVHLAIEIFFENYRNETCPPEKRWVGSKLKLSSIKSPTIQGVSRLYSVPMQAQQRQCSLYYIRGISRVLAWCECIPDILYQGFNLLIVIYKPQEWVLRMIQVQSCSLDHVLLEDEYQKFTHSFGKKERLCLCLWMPNFQNALFAINDYIYFCLPV